MHTLLCLMLTLLPAGRPATAAARERPVIHYSGPVMISSQRAEKARTSAVQDHYVYSLPAPYPYFGGRGYCGYRGYGCDFRFGYWGF